MADDREVGDEVIGRPTLLPIYELLEKLFQQDFPLVPLSSDCISDFLFPVDYDDLVNDCFSNLPSSSRKA